MLIIIISSIPHGVARSFLLLITEALTIATLRLIIIIIIMIIIIILITP